MPGPSVQGNLSGTIELRGAVESIQSTDLVVTATYDTSVADVVTTSLVGVEGPSDRFFSYSTYVEPNTPVTLNLQVNAWPPDTQGPWITNGAWNDPETWSNPITVHEDEQAVRDFSVPIKLLG